MIHSLLSPVKILPMAETDSAVLADMLLFLTGISDRPVRVAVVRDTWPMSARDEFVTALGTTGAEVFEFTDVQPNPRAADIDRMAASAELGRCDVVIGIGGGSALDSAKALAMLAKNGGSLGDYLGSEATRKISQKGLPLVLVPTTAGTGSEVTKVGVYTADSGRKYTLGSPFLLADAAILCGRLTASMPPGLTAATGFDALDHAFESLWNKNATAITKAAARSAAVAVLRTLDGAYDASLRSDNPFPGDAEIRQQMLEASCMAGIAFGITGTAAGHALSFVLSEEWHVPHGAACAFTIEDIYSFALGDPANVYELALVARLFFPDESGELELCGRLLGKIRDMKKRMKLPTTFTELGAAVAAGDIPRYFDRAFTDPKMLNQLPPASPEALYPFLEAMT
ncbi:MAG TPA: iron-containing alcohol dehydrogenase [Treponemataceae bacterium]|nr:iron-containing alcohol dehydrogenase [Treponemataceae bacterium]